MLQFCELHSCVVQTPPLQTELGGQALHWPPPMPHWLGFCAKSGMQRPLSQQPFGHVRGEHCGGPPTHWPLLHVSPWLHDAQIAPPLPQLCSLCSHVAKQLPMMQQPAHDIGPHAGPGTQSPCAEQLVSGGHWLQVAPLRPHAKLSCAASGTQLPCSQQPGHVIASQVEVKTH